MVEILEDEEEFVFLQPMDNVFQVNDKLVVSELLQDSDFSDGSAWDAINPESAARMRAQNKFKTGLDIARYTADIMRADMAVFDNDKTKYTQSLGCWHGFVGQQKMISIKKLVLTLLQNRYFASSY